MARYRLLPKAGVHKQAGVVYRPGQIVENDADLVKLFPNKFECLDGPIAEDFGEDPERVEADNRDRPVRSSRRAPVKLTPQSEPGDEDEPSEEPLEELEDAEDAEEASKSRPAAKKKKKN